MTSAAQISPTLDPKLFGDAPARDARFREKSRWVDLMNFPDDHPLKVVEFFHRQMNEEMNGMENAAQSLADFPDADWNVRLSIARQCADEARHVEMFRRIFESRGGEIGAYPVLNFQYRIIANLPDLLSRLVVQNRSFEAGGIDAVTFAIDEARKRGDQELVELFEMQQADEITHVRFANEYIRDTIRADPRAALRVARALTLASTAFTEVMGREGIEKVEYLTDERGRMEAGFGLEEVKAATTQAIKRRASYEGQ
ncbi:MAG: hypothetical protein DMG70_07020 [Acidobacteria bacterium]|nr:MAG: hypothetical protein DMG70_07020 [Acidobacteriota bacterium]PYY07406.1 MAG: hypothetical protein DMG69_19600 [Acidobacteriota bacterium]